MHFLHIEDNDIVNKIRPSNSWEFGSIKSTKITSTKLHLQKSQYNSF